MATEINIKVTKDKRVKKAMLVYQNGIANVFAVDCFNLSPFGRFARRLLQDSFSACLNFVGGLGAAGVVVRTAHCNKAGDIANATWREDDFNDIPFSDKIVVATLN
jgi:hypothetical protein